MMTVKLDLKGLENFAKAIATNSPAIVKTLKQWGVRYRGFVQRRFNTYSKGGGDWPPLAPATIKRRRKGKRKGGKVAILRDTGTLFRALNPVLGQPGQLEEYPGTFSVRLGIGGPVLHPGSGYGLKGTATIADIASFHNFGMGVPKRQIIVEPDEPLKAKMAGDAERNLNKEAKDTI